MAEQVVDVDQASVPSETRATIVWPAPVVNAAAWNQSASKDSWLKVVNGVQLVVTNQELLAWEKTQHDQLRGVKLRARLDGVIASREAPTIILDSETSPAFVVAEADATGTP